MSQHILDIVDQTASNARVQINLALKALGSTNSGPTAPPTSFANQLWYDTGTNTLKLKEESGSDWISIGYFDQGSGAFSLFDDTKLVDTSGNQTGLLGDQLTATWQGGTGVVQSLVSPANVKAAILALVPASPIKAWVNFNGSGGTLIRGNLNVSSVTRNSVGDYTINFATALASTNYGVTASGSRAGFGLAAVAGVPSGGTKTVNAVRIVVDNGAGGKTDSDDMTVTIVL